ncbi:two-component system response regulator TorR [Aeromonas rivipollensis]|uniref:two-component system response regulator TorR n=1 Tax=Aeromonas TaxID=642 RepID=UPI001F3F269B|nr:MULTISPECIES: two-component system response regulator TorR [Aeromonas]MCE9924803.1 two-component system response regulator TorR [Aeromonas media]MDM5059801.1 two-component system response regulator TorR [Aeromonas rivipollensis]
MSYHILVVEDDAVTREKLTGYFEREGYRVTAVENGQEMRAVLAQQEVDLVMLDINLPGEDGLLLTRELRARSTVGIILVTGRSDAVDRIVGLEMGADDYVTKPFELRELLVRVKNLLWRISLAAAATRVAEPLDDAVYFGPWRFDIPRRQLSKDGVPVRLTKAEYEVLVAFVAHPGRVLSRERILTLISHRGDGPSDRTIDVLIRRLRGKMELDPRDPQLFVTVHGEGYLFAGELAP